MYDLAKIHAKTMIVRRSGSDIFKNGIRYSSMLRRTFIYYTGVAPIVAPHSMNETPKVLRRSTATIYYKLCTVLCTVLCTSLHDLIYLTYLLPYPQ